MMRYSILNVKATFQNKFLVSLVSEIMNQENTPGSIQLASVLFKNTLNNPTKVISVPINLC
jgi:hypothetical protein